MTPETLYGFAQLLIGGCAGIALAFTLARRRAQRERARLLVCSDVEAKKPGG